MKMRSSNQSIRRVGGFTLLEVMIALTIASIALAAAIAAVSQMVDGANGIRERTYASWIGHNQIAELRLSNVAPEVSTTTSEITYAGQEWALETAISETGVENLFRVDVTVSFVGAETSSGVVTGFIGEPVPPGTANAAWRNISQPSGAGT